MKQKIGLVSKDKTLAEQLKPAAKDIIFVSSTNIIDLFQNYGTQKLERIFLFDDGSLAKDFKGIYSFIRSKPSFQNATIAVFGNTKKFKVEFLLTDVNVRFFDLADGPLPAIQKSFSASSASTIASFAAPEMIITSLEGYLKSSFKSETTWTSQLATAEDMQKPISFQTDRELPTNLLRFKVNVRCLEEGLDSWGELFPDNDPSEVESALQMTLSHTLNQLIDGLLIGMSEAGFIFTPDNYSLPAAERASVLKSQKSTNYLLQNQSRQLILEIISYK